MRYSLNGTLIGSQLLRNQLSFCGQSTSSSVPRYLQYGYSAVDTFTCNLPALLAAQATTGNGPSLDGLSTMEFFELYLVDSCVSLCCRVAVNRRCLHTRLTLSCVGFGSGRRCWGPC